MVKFIKKHKVLFNPGILNQEYNHIRYGNLYWIKYWANKKFRLREQMKRKALDDWNEEINQEIAKQLFDHRTERI